MKTALDKISLGFTLGIPNVSVSVHSDWKIEHKELIMPPPEGMIVIEPYPGESYHFTRPLLGFITGYTAKNIRNRGLFLEVDMFTDAWYPQGRAKIAPNGQWIIETVYFSSIIHTIRARLKDKDNKVITQSSLRVDVIRDSNLSFTCKSMDLLFSIYRNILERNPDIVGIHDYGQQLQAKTKTIRQIVREVGKSDEYNRRFVEAVNPREAIVLLYCHFLGRDPESESIMSEHLDYLSNKGWKFIVDKLTDSSEYQVIFGENTVPYRR